MSVNFVSFKNNDWIFPFRFDFSIKTECYCKYPPWMVLLSSRLRMCFEHLRFLYNKYRSWHLIHHYKSNILLSGKVNIWNLSEPLYLFSENLLYTSVSRSRCCRFVHLSFDTNIFFGYMEINPFILSSLAACRLFTVYEKQQGCFQ